MANYAPIHRAATVFHRHVRTIENWLGQGFIHGFRDKAGAIMVDLSEIETALKTNPRMRDGRRPYGPNAKILPLPSTTAALPPAEERK